MNFSKRSTALCAFAVGAVLLTSSAFADVMIGSGYYNLKNAGKTTMAKLSKEVDNFSVEMLMSAKLDGNVFAEVNESFQFDMINHVTQNTGSTLEKGEVKEHFSYEDIDKRIAKDFEADSYHVREKDTKNNRNESSFFENPFEDEQAADAEKILDAFVGNLQDIVQIEDAGDKKVYTGNLSDTQIPPLINAVSSFALKYSIMDERAAKSLGIPSPKSNIYVIDAAGKAIENADGIIESMIGSGSISATDKDGAEHIYSFELSINIKDINSTVISEPDISGQEVEYSKESSSLIDQKYVGTYKNIITTVQDNAFVKKGERIVEITSVDDNTVSGKYYETYSEGYTPKNPHSFEFTVNLEDSQRHYMLFNYVENGEQKTGVINYSGRNSQNLNLELNIEPSYDDDGLMNGYSNNNYEDDFDSEFTRIFE